MIRQKSHGKPKRLIIENVEPGSKKLAKHYFATMFVLIKLDIGHCQ